MKTTISLILFGAWLAAQAGAQTASLSQMRDASTHEQLSLAARKAAQSDPMRHMTPAKGNDPSLVNQPQDLIATSDILSFGGSATLVPKRAILMIPKNLASRIKFEPGSKIQSWADFYAGNRGWITTVEVSRVQAEGNKPLDEELSKRIGKSSNLVVATYQGGPISVLPLKVPAENAKEIPVQTAKAQ